MSAGEQGSPLQMEISTARLQICEQVTEKSSVRWYDIATQRET